MQGPEKNRTDETVKGEKKTGKSRGKQSEESVKNEKISIKRKKKDIAPLEAECDLFYRVSRLEYIRLKLQRGDKKSIADRLNVHPEWVSQVIRGKGVSEPVIQEAERIIRKRAAEEESEASLKSE